MAMLLTHSEMMAISQRMAKVDPSTLDLDTVDFLLATLISTWAIANMLKGGDLDTWSASGIALLESLIDQVTVIRDKITPRT